MKTSVKKHPFFVSLFCSVLVCLLLWPKTSDFSNERSALESIFASHFLVAFTRTAIVAGVLIVAYSIMIQMKDGKVFVRFRDWEMEKQKVSRAFQEAEAEDAEFVKTNTQLTTENERLQNLLIRQQEILDTQNQKLQRYKQWEVHARKLLAERRPTEN